MSCGSVVRNQDYFPSVTERLKTNSGGTTSGRVVIPYPDENMVKLWTSPLIDWGFQYPAVNATPEPCLLMRQGNVLPILQMNKEPNHHVLYPDWYSKDWRKEDLKPGWCHFLVWLPHYSLSPSLQRIWMHRRHFPLSAHIIPIRQFDAFAVNASRMCEII